MIFVNGWLVTMQIAKLFCTVVLGLGLIGVIKQPIHTSAFNRVVSSSALLLSILFIWF